MYWKRGKNFANGQLTTKHVENATVVNGWYMLPGGPFTFWMKDVKLVGWSSIQFPQHGFSPTMSVQVVLEGMDWSDSTATTRLRFGSSGGNPVTLIYLTRDESLGGHHALVSRFLNGFASVKGCSGPLGELWDRSYGCDKSVRVRRLNIWGPNMGTIKLSGPGYNVPPMTYAEADIWNYELYAGANAGNMHFDKDITRGGYATPVIAGESYTIEALEWQGDVIFEFSDQLAEEYFGEPEVVYLTLVTPQGSVDCVVRADADRRFLAKSVPEGMLPDASWELGDCGKKFRQVTGQPVWTPPKERAPLAQLTWVHHPSNNCYHGVGAESARNGGMGEVSLSDCKKACERDWGCEGVIVAHNRDPTACWTIKNIDLPQCAKGGGFDLWRLEMSGFSDSTVVPTSAPAAMPAPTSVPKPALLPPTVAPTFAPRVPAEWTRYEGLNCYGGRGADAAAGDWVGEVSTAACKEACVSEVQCEGIIVVREQNPGPCWLRKNIDPPSCSKNSPWDLWVHSVGESTPTAKPTTPAPTSAASAPTTSLSGQLTCARGRSANILGPFPHMNSSCISAKVVSNAEHV